MLHKSISKIVLNNIKIKQTQEITFRNNKSRCKTEKIYIKSTVWGKRAKN